MKFSQILSDFKLKYLGNCWQCRNMEGDIFIDTITFDVIFVELLEGQMCERVVIISKVGSYNYGSFLVSNLESLSKEIQDKEKR